MCPVCKTIRYLNKDMEFLINPECYHPMCVNCVNRLFNDGPNQCPYAGCHKTLRRKGFRSAFFGDLGIEREVDIRRRVAAVFNNAEDDFETLRDYNDYLQTVEDLTFDLVSGSEAQRRAAEARLQQWEAEHRADIERNRRAGRDADDLGRRRRDAERDSARQRRIEAAREMEEERAQRAREREAKLDRLAHAPDGVTDAATTDSSSSATAAPGATGVGKIQLKKRGQQQSRVAGLAASAAVTAAAAADSTADMTGAAGRLSIRGLKEKRKPPTPAAEIPYDPFGGMEFVAGRYRVRDGYKNDWLEKARLETSHVVGGYDVREYYARSMFDAFAGLGVFVEDEKEDGSGRGGASAATKEGDAAAGPLEAAPAVKMEVDDVFG